MHKNWLDIVTYVLLGLAFVAAITHGPGFAQAVSSVGGFIMGESSILAGGAASSSKLKG